jgi:hypothetical protein
MHIIMQLFMHEKGCSSFPFSMKDFVVNSMALSYTDRSHFLEPIKTPSKQVVMWRATLQASVRTHAADFTNSQPPLVSSARTTPFFYWIGLDRQIH